MDMFTVEKADFHAAVQKMVLEKIVYGVKKKQSRFIFDRLTDDDGLRLDHDITLLPPNRFLFPPRESLMKFTLSPQVQVSESITTEPFILLGIHPYDLHAIKLMDAVFTGGEMVDVNYKARRNNMTLIGIDCLYPWPYSFASSMGTAFPPPIFDLWLTDLGDKYFLESGSEKGMGMIAKYIRVKKATGSDVALREELRQDSLDRYRLILDIDPTKIPEVLEKGADSPMWEELGKKCFSCGTCTMVCPTCVCFDIRDRMELNGKEGERYRQWDSCMFNAFAEVAGGENFRPSGTDRLRHRLYRKGRYMIERWGESGCVGCGRCVQGCLVDIASPVDAYNRLAKETENE